ncbi:MAG: tetratricopeptide repeat protein [Syntrophobacteraceae bacterium]
MADLADNINKYKEILEIDPRSQVFVLLAEDLCSAGHWQEAIAVCRKGLHFYPDHMSARVQLGRALKEVDQNEESERILSGVAEEIRKSSLAFKLLSEIAAASGKEENSTEYAGIYQALTSSGPARIEPAPTEEPPEIVEEATAQEPPIVEELSTIAEPTIIEEPPAIVEEASTQEPSINEELSTIAEPTIIEEPPEIVEEASSQASPAIVEPPMIEDIPDVAAPSKPMSEWDRFKAEAIEKLNSESESHESVKADFENILRIFAHRFDYRLIETAGFQTIFADNQKELLKERIMALMGQ